MATSISHSPAETEALGEAWGRAAENGLVIRLTGDLGAGKTQLVKGLARGLGITARIQSPTFALINIYTEGRLPLFHLDLYRLETRAQIDAAGLDEYLCSSEGVTVIEWAERWEIRRPISEGRRKSDGRYPKAETPSAQSPPQRALVAPQSSGGGIRNTYRRVCIETLSDTERRITYEDIGD